MPLAYEGGQHMQCIEVEGGRNTRGYGAQNLRIGGGRYGIAQHRVAWEQAWGMSIPPGMVVRHTCDNPACVNPLHLQLGTQADNMRDRIQRGRWRGRWPRQAAECRRGHPRSGDNLYIVPSTGKQMCRACARINDKKRNPRRRRVA